MLSRTRFHVPTQPQTIWGMGKPRGMGAWMVVIMVHLTPTEEKYMAYLSTPRTYKEMMEHFGSSASAVQQMVRGLRLKGIVAACDHVNNCAVWQVVDTPTPMPLTSLQKTYLKEMRKPRSTTDIMRITGQSYEAAIQVIRTLRLAGYIEKFASVGHPHGGCSMLWVTTDAGLKTLRDDNNRSR